jgi:REP element-mobilizing transposase RayT
MKGERVRIEKTQAEALIEQFQETASYRGWSLLAAAIMFNHVHWVVTVPGDPILPIYSATSRATGAEF